MKCHVCTSGQQVFKRAPGSKSESRGVAWDSESTTMPLYDLVCILRTSAPRKAIADVLRRAAETVMDANGVVTDITNYGKRDLAYSIKRSGENIVQVRGVAAVARLLRPALRPAERGGRQSAGSACGCRCAAPRAAAP